MNRLFGLGIGLLALASISLTLPLHMQARENDERANLVQENRIFIHRPDEHSKLSDPEFVAFLASINVIICLNMSIATTEQEWQISIRYRSVLTSMPTQNTCGYRNLRLSRNSNTFCFSRTANWNSKTAC
ncbi:hypothetical protein [Neorhodopirellula lusitana]|uniref:hypothetical protein n=1 Tax=Neorhodopirellula lusitana TaxID=445327 RepID=UPI00384ED771